MKQHAEIIFDEIEENEQYSKIINKVIAECFNHEKLDQLELYISITLTVPNKIQQANKQYRNIDRATDVLSFPMFEREEIQNLIAEKYDVKDILGDIIISIPKVEEQAEEYGHSFERELAYMCVHGFYHLMGYDHIKEDDKKEMREKEDEILNKLGIVR